VFLIVWEFVAAEGREAEFERVYNRDGDWAQLFCRGNGYVRTELNRDLNEERTYAVFDYWESEEAYEQFKKDFADDYLRLDERCEELTERENRVGSFEVLP
jgi:heme-degrading monooxygenase HmoA